MIRTSAAWSPTPAPRWCSCTCAARRARCTARRSTRTSPREVSRELAESLALAAARRRRARRDHRGPGHRVRQAARRTASRCWRASASCAVARPAGARRHVAQVVPAGGASAIGRPRSATGATAASRDGGRARAARTSCACTPSARWCRWRAWRTRFASTDDRAESSRSIDATDHRHADRRSQS